jgi:hypothetical protein
MFLVDIGIVTELVLSVRIAVWTKRLDNFEQASAANAVARLGIQTRLAGVVAFTTPRMLSTGRNGKRNGDETSRALESE